MNPPLPSTPPTVKGAINAAGQETANIGQNIGKAYTGATKALQGVGAGIRNAVGARIQEQKNYDSQIDSGNLKNYYGTNSQFKKAKRK